MKTLPRVALAFGLLLTTTAALAFGGLPPTEALNDPDIVMLRMPEGTPAGVGAYALDERRVALAGAQAVVQQEMFSHYDTDGLVEDLSDAYKHLYGEQHPVPTPLVNTAAHRQGPEGFDMLVAPAPSQRAAVLYLHGYGGSFTLQCWMVARGARDAGLPTFCPANTYRGAWWEPEGLQILEQTLDWLESKGNKRVYLVGLSNGGHGASAQAAAVATRIHGVVTLSGTRPGVPEGLPWLGLHGRGDRMTSFSKHQQLVQAHPRGRFVGMPGGHFTLLAQRDTLKQELGRWLQQRETR